MNQLKLERKLKQAAKDWANIEKLIPELQKALTGFIEVNNIRSKHYEGMSKSLSNK